MFSNLVPIATPRPQLPHYHHRHNCGKPYAAAPSLSKDQGNSWMLYTLLLLLLPGAGLFIKSQWLFWSYNIVVTILFLPRESIIDSLKLNMTNFIIYLSS